MADTARREVACLACDSPCAAKPEQSRTMGLGCPAVCHLFGSAASDGRCPAPRWTLTGYDSGSTGVWIDTEPEAANYATGRSTTSVYDISLITLSTPQSPVAAPRRTLLSALSRSLASPPLVGLGRSLQPITFPVACQRACLCPSGHSGLCRVLHSLALTSQPSTTVGVICRPFVIRTLRLGADSYILAGWRNTVDASDGILSRICPVHEASFATSLLFFDPRRKLVELRQMAMTAIICVAWQAGPPDALRRNKACTRKVFSILCFQSTVEVLNGSQLQK
jgi:hypothetical protein